MLFFYTLLFLCIWGGSGWRWDTIKTSQESLSPRVGHTATLFTRSAASRPSLLSCGGVDAAGVPLASCDELDPFNSWRVTRNAVSSAGLARVDGVVAVLGDYLVAWGGASAVGAVNVSLDVCQVLTVGTWAPPVPTGMCVEPPPVNGSVCGDTYRWGASGVVFKGALWVYAGAKVLDGVALAVDVSDDENVPSLLVLVQDSTTPGSFLWTIPVVIGQRPSPRHLHAAAVLAQRFPSESSLMFVQGGFSFTTNAALDDLWTLRLGDSSSGSGGVSWLRLLGALGGADSSLWGHRLLIVGDRLLAIGGAGARGASGVIERDARAGSDGVWTRPIVTDSAPTNPFRAAATVLYADGNADPQVLVLGGSAVGDEAVAEGTLTALVDIDVNTPTETAVLPLALSGAAMGVCLLIGFAYVTRFWRTTNTLPHSYSFYVLSGEDEESVARSLLGSRNNNKMSPSPYGAAGSLAKARAYMLGESNTNAIPMNQFQNKKPQFSSATPPPTSSSRSRASSRGSVKSTSKRKASMGGGSTTTSTRAPDHGFDADAFLVTDIEARGEANDAVMRF